MDLWRDTLYILKYETLTDQFQCSYQLKGVAKWILYVEETPRATCTCILSSNVKETIAVWIPK